jgi:hypothetical protein
VVSCVFSYVSVNDKTKLIMIAKKLEIFRELVRTRRLNVETDRQLILIDNNA